MKKEVRHNQEDDQYLVIGVEDGWIYVDSETWIEYLKAKERLENEINFSQ